MVKKFKNILLLFLTSITLTVAAQSNDSTIVVGEPLIYKKDTLFYIHSKFGPFKPHERVLAIEKRINSVVDVSDFDPDSLFVADFENSTDVMWRDIVLFSLTNGDAEVIGNRE
ncbi:MAG: hypothetical protein HC811_09185 [Flammeovirgaceae bacterium]|nr:hypothetical protein [Flammeovirgaceae bacterium]